MHTDRTDQKRVFCQYINYPGKTPSGQIEREPHISTATKTLTKEQTRLFYTTQNPAYSLVLEQSIWGKALSKVVVDGIFPKQAANEAINQIKQVFAQWQ